MLSNFRAGFLALITVVLVACGGGGGGDTPNFAGNYQFADLVLTSNNCNAAVPGSIPGGGGDTVTQNGSAVTINSDGTVLTGSVDGDNGGFSVSVTQTTNGIPVLSTFAFRTISGNNYQVKFTTTAGTCSAIYIGTATKL